MKDIKKIIENQVVVNSDGVLCIESFLNQMLDVELLHDIAKEWNSRFKDANITKILTIESGGIALATALGLLINVPVVYAKKEYFSLYLKVENEKPKNILTWKGHW